MSSVGPYLRDLRERRGVSLEEISRTTRVGRSYLEALEAGDLARLPAPVFTRGFVVAYCQALGEAPDEALARYTGRADGRTDDGLVPAATPRERAGARARGTVLVSFVLLVVLGVALFAVALVLQSSRDGAGERRAEARRGGDVRATPRAPEPRRDAPAPAPSTATSPSGVAALTVDTPPRDQPTSAAGASTASPTGLTPPPPPETATSGPAAKPLAPAATMTQQEVTSTIGQVNAPYRLVARTTALTWMRVRTDDGHQSEETIPPGQVREWVSNRPFTLSIGNAGGVRLELNGRPLPPLGASGAVITRIVLPETP
jgi:cytoskeletal protein RodZ